MSIHFIKICLLYSEFLLVKFNSTPFELIEYTFKLHQNYFNLFFVMVCLLFIKFVETPI